MLNIIDFSILTEEQIIEINRVTKELLVLYGKRKEFSESLTWLSFLNEKSEEMKNFRKLQKEIKSKEDELDKFVKKVK